MASRDRRPKLAQQVPRKGRNRQGFGLGTRTCFFTDRTISRPRRKSSTNIAGGIRILRREREQSSEIEVVRPAAHIRRCRKIRTREPERVGALRSASALVSSGQEPSGKPTGSHGYPGQVRQTASCGNKAVTENSANARGPTSKWAQGVGCSVQVNATAPRSNMAISMTTGRRNPIGWVAADRLRSEPTRNASQCCERRLESSSSPSAKAPSSKILCRLTSAQKPQ
jgi:hypothetical protein